MQQQRGAAGKALEQCARSQVPGQHLLQLAACGLSTGRDSAVPCDGSSVQVVSKRYDSRPTRLVPLKKPTGQGLGDS